MTTSSHAWRLSMALFALALLASFAVPAASGRIDSFWSANGNVYAAVTSGNTLYIGGDFTYVGPSTGSWAALDTGVAGYDATWPRIVGTVYAAIPDGAGGWYLGGDITQVGASYVSSIAHINADKSVDTAFTATANSTVWTLALVGNTLYVGGQFTTLDGQSRPYLGAVDAASGALNAWNPAANNIVYTLVVSGATLYTGGSFTSLGGVTRNRIAAIDTGSGAITAWNPSANSTVYSLVVDNAIVYAGGSFTSIGGQSRNRIAALAATTGLASAWNPNATSASVRCMALSGGVLYVGGGFIGIGGQSRNRIAALDTATGLATAWNPNAGSPVRALTVVGSTVYIGGVFTTVGGQSFNHIAALDSATAAPTSWNPGASGNVYTLTQSGDQLFAGGAFASVGGVTRNHIAAIDIVSGQATDWDPDISGTAVFYPVTVYALAIDGGTLYAGGYFNAVGGITRNNIAAIDVASGIPTGWDPDITGSLFYKNVRTLAIDDGVVYAGGLFYDVGGSMRNNLAAIDKSSGAATAWNPNADGQVSTLVRDGTSLYVGGTFTTIGGASRSNLAQLDTATGLAGSWTANADGSVYTLALDGSTLYAGGEFLNINGTPRAYLGAVDTSTALLGAWSPGVDSIISALAVNGPNVYIGGDFSNINGATRYYLGSVDKTSGAVTAWDPEPDTSINALAANGERLYLGGYYDSSYATSWQGLSAIEFTPPDAAITPTAGVYGTSQSVVLSCIDHSGAGCAGTYYTLDGSTPTRDSSLYSAPLTIAGNTTLKFFATDNDGIDGTVQTANYVIDGVAPVTAASLLGGLFISAQFVTLACADANSGCAAIYYTTDGSMPTTSSAVYVGAIAIGANTDLKFFSVDNAGNAEAVQSVSYVIDSVAPVTTTSVLGGLFSSAQSVTLTCADANSGCAATYYTTDGSTPTTSATVYVGAIAISANTDLKFFSVDNAGNAEAVQSVSYVIDGAAPVTGASVAGGTYSSAQSVALACADANSGCAATYYTTDGGTPTTSSAVYVGAITISANTDLKFFSVDNAGNAEAAQSISYVIDSAAPVTGASVAGGTYSSAQSVALACADANSGCAATYYTTDGGTPTTSSALYVNAIAISANTNLKFFSVDNAGNAEAVQSVSYVIDGVTPVTGASLASGGYNSAQSVTLACTDANSGCAAIYYTTDGSSPTTSSVSYAGAIVISANTDLKFFSVDNAGNAEAARSVSYVIDTIAPVTMSAPGAGSYDSVQAITLLCGDDNSGCAATYFTTDNSAPDFSSTLYVEPFTLYMDTTLRFFSVDEVGNAESGNSVFYAINTAPVAADASLSVAEDTALNGQLSASDLQGDALAFSIVSGPGKGQLVITDAASGSFIYTPDLDAEGEDSFTFTASDARFDSNTATVTIAIAPANDPPAVLGNGIKGLIAGVGGTVSVAFGVQDVDGGDTHTYSARFASSSASTANVGVATMSGSSLTFTALAAGSDTLTVTVMDGAGLASSLSLPVTVSAGAAVLLDSNADGLSNSVALILGLDPASPGGDSDADGIADALEVGDLIHPSDTDGDGIIDALEVGVVADDPRMLEFRVSAMAAGVLSLPELSGQVLRLSGSGVLSAHNNASLGLPVYAKSQVATPDPGYEYPYGVLDFSVIAADGTATVTLQLPASLELSEDMEVRKYGSAGWRTLTDAVIDRVNHTITLHLIDNDDVDLDPRVGIIRDPVGLTVPASGGAGGGGALEPLWLLALLGVWCRAGLRRVPTVRSACPVRPRGWSES